MRQELHQQIQAFLNGHETLISFESWLMANLQAILDSGDQELIGLANEMDADIVELREGIIDESAFSDHLESLLSQLETICINVPNTQTSDELTVAYSTASVETVVTEVNLPVGAVTHHWDPVSV